MPEKPKSPLSAMRRALANLREAEDNGNVQNASDLITYLKLYGYRIVKQ